MLTQSIIKTNSSPKTDKYMTAIGTECSVNQRSEYKDGMDCKSFLSVSDCN